MSSVINSFKRPTTSLSPPGWLFVPSMPKHRLDCTMKSVWGYSIHGIGSQDPLGSVFSSERENDLTSQLKQSHQGASISSFRLTPCLNHIPGWVYIPRSTHKLTLMNGGSPPKAFMSKQNALWQEFHDYGWGERICLQKEMTCLLYTSPSPRD